ncbi:MAG: hypothetical protein ABSC95_12325 [Acetobacteraceae bacterium]|jgi:hypothetical protein
MAIVTWTPIQTLPLPTGLIALPWLKLVDTIRGATHLMINAKGRWTPMPGLLAPCEPDGLAGLVLPADRTVLPDAPPGALIGRIGGSSAGLKADGAFVIGTSCVVPVPAGSIGPLFISFNITARPVDVAAIQVDVSGATPTL